VPESKKQIWFQTLMLQFMLRLPGKERIFKRILAATQHAVNDAANAISLRPCQLLAKKIRSGKSTVFN
jgi:hypothetical protein